MKGRTAPKRLARTLSDPFADQAPPTERTDLLQLRDLVTFLNFALDESPIQVKQCCHELSNKIREISHFPNDFIDETGILAAIGRVFASSRDPAVLEIVLDGLNHLLSRSVHGQAVVGMQNPEATCLDLLACPAPAVRRGACGFITALCQTPDGAKFVGESSILRCIIETMRQIMGEFADAITVPEMALGFFGDCFVILQAVAYNCENGFEPLLPVYFEILDQVFDWVHGYRSYPDVISTFVYIALLHFEPEILREKWILEKILPLMEDPVNRACFRPILGLCTQLLRCETAEFDLPELLPPAFVHHCVNLYVHPEFHELDYLDFFINFALIDSCCLDILLENVELLPFCCLQAGEGTVREQRAVRRLFWSLLYIATVDQMDKFMSVICEFLADSFDDDDTDNFVRDALGAVDKVLIKIEIKGLQAHDIDQRFMREVIPRIPELATGGASQRIMEAAQAILKHHIDIVEPYLE
jgi:hypothetical protein